MIFLKINELDRCYCCENNLYLYRYNNDSLLCCSSNCYYILYTLNRYIINKNGFYIYNDDKMFKYKVGFLDKIEIYKNGDCYYVDDKYTNLNLDYLFKLNLNNGDNLLDLTNFMKKENLIFV